MAAKEQFYPNIYKHGYTYSRFKNISYVSHVHMSVEGVYVLGGSIQMTVDGHKYVLREGDAAFVMPYHRHSYQTPQSSDVFAFAVMPEDLLSTSPFFDGEYDLPMPILRRGSFPESVGSLVHLLLDPQTRSANMDTHVGLLHAIIGYLFEANPPQKTEKQQLSIENRVLLYLHNNIYKPITLSQAAEELDISQFKISRICNQEIGYGFNAYLRAMRVAAAKRRLVFTDLPIAEIAEEIGFESLRTFNRAFSEETGTSPRAYRSSHKDQTILNFRPGEEQES